MSWPPFQGHHIVLPALLPLHPLVMSAGSTHLQPGPLRFMVPVSPKELSSADADMEEEDLEEDVEEDLDPGEAIAQQIVQQAPVVPVELADQSMGWGALLPYHCPFTHWKELRGQLLGGVLLVVCTAASQHLWPALLLTQQAGLGIRGSYIAGSLLHK